MYKVFDSMEDLYQEIDADKHWTGAESAVRNRYPLRFVLFETFNDFNEFVNECSNHHVHIQKMEKWLPDGYDDLLLTYSQMAKYIEDYIKHLPANDFVIVPFSEIARFYDNGKYAEFNSLLQTIRLIESPEEAQKGHQRIYVPIIGMQGKVSKFKNDPNIHIWEYRSSKENQNYKLILSTDTYGVRGLEKNYTVCKNMKQWIALWQTGNDVKQNIICTSKSIFNNAHNAQPDNAFEYVICHNAGEFLRKGLKLDVGAAEPVESEMHFWEQLAGQIDADDFDFEQFTQEKFNTLSLSDAAAFVQTWMECEDGFSRWLLKRYYLYKYNNSTYLAKALSQTEKPKNSELFSCIATLAFDEAPTEEELRLRYELLKEAQKQKIQITDLAEKKIKAKLAAMASDPAKGHHVAMKYMSPFTLAERCLLVEWLGKGSVQRESVQRHFQELYDYTASFNLQLEEPNAWVNTYFGEYVKAKLSGSITDSLHECLLSKNPSSVKFEEWKNRFKTVKTVLHNRTDIDVYYWIDGLGVDWIPFVTRVIEKHNMDGIYLNEVHICAAELPTTTAVNKARLEELSDGTLNKIGDLDSFAHSPKEYPAYIIEELNIVENAIHKVLSQYNGKKIAFVSDHGISYMAQYGKGLKMAGITPDHGGRCARWDKGNAPHDSNYVILDDGRTLCSLGYDSLTAKTPKGQGAHGGATPEEVLVPVIIVSSRKNASNYSATLLENEIEATNPVVQYCIKGISNIDTPIVIYNGVEYDLHKTNGDYYQSERLHLVDTATRITLQIGEFKQTDTLKISTGAEENELF